jgi:hypothetical protein
MRRLRWLDSAVSDKAESNASTAVVFPSEPEDVVTEQVWVENQQLLAAPTDR